MSGHSHYSTIKRQKALKDAAKGKIFSRHSKAIAIAIKSGGGADPAMNSKLRFAIDQAKSDNMPKVNIDRILARAEEVGNLDEVLYEGYGPGGVAVIVDAATDNKNRTGQEIKNIFERGGGNLAGPGSVSYNFEPKGLIVVKKDGNKDEQMLKLIDLGVDDIEEADDAFEVYVTADKTSEVKDTIQNSGMFVNSMEIIRKPKTLQDVDDKDMAQRILSFLEKLEDHEDVQGVFSNVDISENLLTDNTS